MTMTKRIAAAATLAALLGMAACSKEGGGDYQGGSEGATGTSEGMMGGANTGSNAGPANPVSPGPPAVPMDSAAAAAAAGPPPVQSVPTESRDISIPTGRGTPPPRPPAP